MRRTARTTLILGGARSGKSRVAEDLTLAQTADGARAVYLATAQADDDEMRARIADHAARRGERWETVEEPLDLPRVLVEAAEPDRAVLVDCLTLWLSNLMHAGRDVAAETANLVEALDAVSGPVVLVSNEVGQGIVPDNALARAFRDLAGVLHQTCATECDRVLFVTAGLVQTLKESAEEPQ